GGRARTARAGPGGGGDRPPVRSRARPAAARSAAAAERCRGAGDAPDRAHRAPHRRRRLVAGHPRAGDRGPLPAVPRRPAVAAAPPAGAGPGLRAPLPELAVRYGAFAVWQRSWLAGGVLDGEIAFWRRQLAGLPPLLALPTDRPRPAVQSFRGAARAVRLPPAL